MLSIDNSKINMIKNNNKLFQRVSTVFRMKGGREGGEGKKDLPTNFSPVTSTNVGISPKIFLTFSFNIYATLM